MNIDKGPTTRPLKIATPRRAEPGRPPPMPANIRRRPIELPPMRPVKDDAQGDPRLWEQAA